MTLVVDASVLVAALTNNGPSGVWSEQVLSSGVLIAPQLVEVESLNILRRLRLAKRLSVEDAERSFCSLANLQLDLQPFAPFAERIWQLKDNVTCYDAWYVAIAESFALPLATLDFRLARVTSLRCEIRTPPH